MNKKLLNFLLRKLLPLLFHLGVDLIQVVVKVFEDHIQLFGYQKNFLQFDDGRMIELP